METEIDRLKMQVAALTARVIAKDEEFNIERSVWASKERRYKQEIRDLKAVRRRIDNEVF